MKAKNIATKTFVFLVCRPNGTAEFADVSALNPANAVRKVVARFPSCRFNIVNIY